MEQLPPEAESLSPLGQTVFRHLVLGKAEKRIADELAASLHTVHGQIKAIYRQFGVSSKPELISWVVRRQATEIERLREALLHAQGKTGTTSQLE